MAQYDAITKRKDGAWEMDTAAFLPDPQGFIKVNGEEYPVFSYLDIPVEDSIKIVKLGERISASADMQERMNLSVEHLMALNAGPREGRDKRKMLTAEMLLELTPRHIVTLVTIANSIAAVPQMADESASPSESASSQPASAVSTDGATTK
jgi:hypothetical protein